MNYLCKRCTIVTEITASLLPKVLHCCYRKHCTFIYRNYCILSYRYQLIEGITEGVKESMIQIVSLILTEKSIRASEIAEKLNKPYKTLERHISLLKQIGAIEYIGSKRAGGYEVSEDFKKLSGK